MIQNAQCDAESGIYTIDYIDTVEFLADKMKNIVKAGSHNFTYPQGARQKINYNFYGSDENG